MQSTSFHKELEYALKSGLDGEVCFDKFSRILYSTDASNYQIEPIGIVIPKSIEDVFKTVEIARKYSIPILPRGSGTSLAGQAVGEALVIDFSKYLNKLLSVDTEGKTARVQPGIYIDTLNQELKPVGLMFGPDPATAKIATVGGVVNNNATGAHSILYGMAGDNLVSARVILSDGASLELAAFEEETVLNKSLKRDTEGRLYKSILEIRSKYSSAIRSEFPRHWRRASGYSLPYLLDSPLNLAKLLASSEGTLAIATELTLKLVTRPRYTGLAILQFEDLIASMEAVPTILDKNPSAIELIDRMLIELTREHKGYKPLLSFLEGNPSSILIVEFYGDNEEDIKKKTKDLSDYLKQKKIRCSVNYAISPESQLRVWAVRKAGLGLLMSKRDDFKPIPCIEDVSVPVDNLSKYVQDILSIIDRLGTRAGFYGHASAGCLHVRPLINLKTSKGIAIMKELTEEACSLAMKYGGVMSGEHGDGLQRSYLNKRLFGPTLYQAMLELKSAFDPMNLFNPDKVVGSSPPDKNLRYGEEYKTIDIPTYLDWSSDKGFARAVEMCNGQGICRKLNEEIMCPSYMATRDERDTTRARANALRAVLSGRLKREELTSKDIYNIFELCILCKGCKKECPSRVDVAKMKIEFLAHYNRAHGISTRDYIFGHIHKISQIASYAPRLFNVIKETAFSKHILSTLGIHPNRSLPYVAKPTFTEWFYKTRSKKTLDERKEVVYFHDTWTTFYYPEIGRATVELLEAAGFRVIIVPKRACCGRPLLSKGMVESARLCARKNVKLLSPYIRKGIPVIGTEPSCILTFRDEYLDLIPDDEEAKLLAKNSFLLEEFLLQLKETNSLDIRWKNNERKVFFHAHCHQRSLAGSIPSLEILHLAGCVVTESKAGCCGMAGSFGYEKEHYGVSSKIGEDRLFPSIRNLSDDATVVVTGVSCRQQIEHFTKRYPKHIAEVLAEQVS